MSNLPNLPARPIRWRYVSESRGTSMFTTTLTFSQSIPREVLRKNLTVISKMKDLIDILILINGHFPWAQPFVSQDLIFNSPLFLLHITFTISYENLVMDQDNIFCLISLCILITCLSHSVWIF